MYGYLIESLDCDVAKTNLVGNRQALVKSDNLIRLIHASDQFKGFIFHGIVVV